MSRKVFNFEKTDYEKPLLFLGQEPGLLDTVNKRFPKIWELYKTQKSLDWDENEFDYTSCNADFKKADRSTYDMMIKTLAWQWEADSIASRAIAPVLAPFITSSELWAAWARITENECLVEGTEALTPTGWVDLKDVTTNTEIAQYDIDGTVQFVKPLRIVDKNYEGGVYNFTSGHNHVNQAVTPKHRMYFRYNKKNRHLIEHAENVVPKEGSGVGRSFVVAGKLSQEGQENLTPIEQFLIASQADGSISKRHTGEICGTIPVWFAFSKERKIERLIEICKLTGFKLHELTGVEKRGKVKAKRRFKVDVPLEHASNLKDFDWVTLEGKTSNWGKEFLTEVSLWDGHFTKNTGILVTSDKEVAEIVQAVAVVSGFKTHLAEREDDRSENFSNCWRLSWKAQDFHSAQDIGKEVYNYSGRVRCVTVPSGLFIVRYKNAVSVTGNCIHAAAYSEIVRNSFDDPSTIIDEILSVQEAHERLSKIIKAFDDAYVAAHKYAIGQLENNQDTYNAIIMMVVALYCLERIQFMASFAVTFAICDTGMFQPIGKAVQKIAQDELEVHAELDKVVLQHEFTTERGKVAFDMLKDDMVAMINEVVDLEIEWIDYLFSEGRELVGLNKERLTAWTLYCAKEVFQSLGLENTKYEFPATNPLKFMEKWLNISKTQASPQEQDIAAYKVGVMRRNDDGMVFDDSF